MPTSLKISLNISVDYVEIYNGKRYDIGIEGAKEHVIGVKKTYPDLKLEIIQQFCEVETVATSYKMTGTHSGEWMGMKPTNKKIEVYGVNIDHIIKGKIIEHGGVANLPEPFLGAEAIKIAN